MVVHYSLLAVFQLSVGLSSGSLSTKNWIEREVNGYKCLYVETEIEWYPVTKSVTNNVD